MPQMLADAREPARVLYYGPGGTGKTTALAAMANLGRVFAINAEGGLKRSALMKRGINIGNIEVFPGPGETLTVDGLVKYILTVREKLDKDPDAYVGGFVDSVTDLHQVLLRQAAEDAVRRAQRAGRDRSAYMTEQADYGVMTEQMRDVMRKLRDLPCHLGASALERREQDPDGSVFYVWRVTPALQGDFDLWFDVICSTSVERVGPVEEYTGRFRPAGKYRGKDRLGVLPRGLVDPTFDRIVAYVEGDLSIENDEVMKAAAERRQKLEQEALEQQAA